MMQKPLKVLMVLHMRWDAELGGPQPMMEIAREMRGMGHTVVKFDAGDAFPRPAGSLVGQIAQGSFAGKARAFVRTNAHEFDVIEAHQGNLPFAKKELGFEGLLVTRSAGLYIWAVEAQRLAAKRWPRQPRGKLGGRILRSYLQRREIASWRRSLEVCDLINVPNADEARYISDVMGLRSKSIVIPYAVSDDFVSALAREMESPQSRLANARIVFIGRWTTAKGSMEWGEIVRRVREQIPVARFLFLGTGCPPESVLRDLALPPSDSIKVVPHYDREQLPCLLASATAGGFPSYAEGLPLGVLEMLAAGLPTVAYDVPGPRELLRRFEEPTLVPFGDNAALAGALVRILRLPTDRYAILSRQAAGIARGTTWKTIATSTVELYSEGVGQLRNA